MEEKKKAINEKNFILEIIKGNDSFSKMSEKDLHELLYEIDNYYLTLRNYLGFDDSITFGLELEFEKAKIKDIREQLKRLELTENYYSDINWLIKSDDSLINGAEITSPILTDKKDTWKKLKEVCEIINQNAIIGENCGGHIHVGLQALGENPESWLNFIKLWAVYENVIYRFSYGKYLTARENIITFAEPLATPFWEDYQSLRKCNDLLVTDIIAKISHKINQAVNFYCVTDLDTEKPRNTIEFRCPNGTLNPVIWQNNVNLFVNILNYSKSLSFNDDIIERRYQINLDQVSNIESYGKIYLQQALELCDMIFTNNLDKIYFLRQYLKSFEIGSKPLIKAKIFTKIE